MLWVVWCVDLLPALSLVLWLFTCFVLLTFVSRVFVCCLAATSFALVGGRVLWFIAVSLLWFGCVIRCGWVACYGIAVGFCCLLFAYLGINVFSLCLRF